MKGGSFRIVDARAMAHHAKLYIIDEAVVLVASANVSGRGLIEAIEAGYVVEHKEHVKVFVQEYDNYFYSPQCIDITQDLIDALNSWLQLARPWDIYLKTLLVLKALEDTQLQQERPAYQQPVGFQKDVVARALRQIEEYGDALAVASTGLGKTTIGTDVALRLQEADKIRNVMVIGPKATEKTWQHYMRSAGLPCDYFIHQVLDVVNAAHNGNVSLLKETLLTLDASWLIIVDECHEMRNRYMEKSIGGKQKIVERLVFQRLVPAIQKSNAKVLLLTGTPYSTEVENVNNELFLLPHRGPTQTLFAEFAEDCAWRVDELSELKELPVASVITTPYVAKYYGTADENGVSIRFNNEPHYIPRVRLFRTDFEIIVEDAMTEALERGCFKVQNNNPMYRASIEIKARVAWASSPWALRHCLEKVLATPGENGYNVLFKATIGERRRILNPILACINSIVFTEDQKLTALCNLLDSLRASDDKVIVFAEQYATVVYLETALKKLRPSLRIASTVKLTKGGKYETKKLRDIEILLADFAPKANKNTRPEAHTYDVFLTTDAFGVGVNMQDARVVINYDLAWTPIEPAQRAGRILRLWHMPRTVDLHVFVPRMNNRTNEYSRNISDVLRRWKTLTRRHSQANIILDLPTLATESEHSFDMRDIAPGQTIELGELDLSHLEEQSSQLEVSSIFRHTAILERHHLYAQHLLDDLRSIRTYSGKKPLIYVLLKHDRKYHWPVYDIAMKQLRPEYTDTQLFELIECDEEEPASWEDENIVEQVADACVLAWCRQYSVEPDQVIRICALYLKPHEQEMSLKEWLEE